MTTTDLRPHVPLAAGRSRNFLRVAAALGSLAILMCGPAQALTDLGKKACAKEARKLCPAEMKSLSRKRVEACMIAKVEQTSPGCREAMYRIKAQREKAAKR